MDVTSAINSLGNDYVAKVTDAMKQSAAVNNTNAVRLIRHSIPFLMLYQDLLTVQMIMYSRHSRLR